MPSWYRYAVITCHEKVRQVFLETSQKQSLAVWSNQVEHNILRMFWWPYCETLMSTLKENFWGYCFPSCIFLCYHISCKEYSVLANNLSTAKTWKQGKKHLTIGSVRFKTDVLIIELILLACLMCDTLSLCMIIPLWDTNSLSLWRPACSDHHLVWISNRVGICGCNVWTYLFT